MPATGHTPLPWFAEEPNEESGAIFVSQHETGNIVARVYGYDDGAGDNAGLRKANAALIVRAVNSHADLVAALKDIAERLDEEAGHLKLDDFLHGELSELRDNARAAIAKAGVR